jgi:hypothetical protein
MNQTDIIFHQLSGNKFVEVTINASGNAGKPLTFGSGGAIESQPPVYDDIQGPYLASNGAAALTTSQFRDTPLYFPVFTNTSTPPDTAGYMFQMPHRKKLGTPLASIHVHCIPLANGASGASGVDWTLRYYWANQDNNEVPVVSSWTTVSGTMYVSVTDAYKARIHTLATGLQPPSGEAYSSILYATVTRSNADTYAGNVGLSMVDCHFQTEKNGSLTEYTD